MTYVATISQLLRHRYEELFLEFIRDDGLNNLSVGLGGFLVTKSLIRILAFSMSCDEPVTSKSAEIKIVRIATSYQ